MAAVDFALPLPVDRPPARAQVTLTHCAALPGLGPLARVAGQLSLRLTEHTYLPKIGHPRTDWIASVAIPALLACRQARAGRPLRRFAAIGTGCGLDGLAAVEVFAPETLLMTDLHSDVTETARDNIRRNLREGVAPELIALSGDLAAPLIEAGGQFDVIYENLPNIPLPSGCILAQGQASSSFHEPRSGCPSDVDQDLLALHYQFLIDARRMLALGGSVLCSIGARRPLVSLLGMAEAAGYRARPLIYTWKTQSEAAEVIAGYAEQEQVTGRPFSFYPPEVMARVFAGVPPREAAHQAGEIDRELAPHRVSAGEALAQLGQRNWAHGVLVLEASPC